MILKWRGKLKREGGRGKESVREREGMDRKGERERGRREREEGREGRKRKVRRVREERGNEER